ncbi:MAG: MBL fold metallo-hydrolase [Bacillota bacterium]|nr:MBL fold metallo-hydrolase [Bacillota bacterium]
MILKQHEVSGGYGSNCYIIGCEETKEAAVIDPGGDGEKIIAILDRHQLTPRYIINTHGHLDHIGANTEIKDKYNCEVLIHEEDQEMLTNPMKNLSGMMGRKIVSPPADRPLKQGDVIEIGNIKLEVIHTPGHTKGGICLRTDDMVFTGDTLFSGSVGRSDFPGGNHTTLINSIKDKLMVLDDDVVVYSGHGPESTIGDEKANNPFLR